MLTRLTINQKALLLAMARSGKDLQPTSSDFIKKNKLSAASTVQRSLAALQEKDIVTNVNGKYFIYDFFLNEWIKKRF